MDVQLFNVESKYYRYYISKEQMRIITNSRIYIYFCFLFVRAHITQFNVSVEELGDDFAAKKIKSIYLLGIVE